MAIHGSKIILGFGATLRRRQLAPFQSFGVVLRRTLSIPIHDSKIMLSRGSAAVRFFERLLKIRSASPRGR